MPQDINQPQFKQAQSMPINKKRVEVIKSKDVKKYWYGRWDAEKNVKLFPRVATVIDKKKQFGNKDYNAWVKEKKSFGNKE